jgi:hypothetical protein
MVGDSSALRCYLVESIALQLLLIHLCCFEGNPKIWSSRSDDYGAVVSFSLYLALSLEVIFNGGALEGIGRRWSGTILHGVLAEMSSHA